MSYLVRNPEDRFSRDEAHTVCPDTGAAGPLVKVYTVCPVFAGRTGHFVGFVLQRGRDFYESTNPYGLSKSPQPAGYLNTTPRRPVGRWYNDKSTYKQDFDEPFFRRGRRVLGNPNKGEYDQWDPFGVPGGGAPRVDATGQRTTQIQRSMGVLGREVRTCI